MKCAGSDLACSIVEKLLPGSKYKLKRDDMEHDFCIVPMCELSSVAATLSDMGKLLHSRYIHYSRSYVKPVTRSSTVVQRNKRTIQIRFSPYYLPFTCFLTC